ncbi:glutamate synthase (NADPH) small subunit [Tistlia consotensis]|uniref:dihydrouracil dehydrogenase (NAD(+)) n=1 Tax=Tistlia consotensis USBA 355 TaxID=560819 RepID=A0A1Y6BVD5_9PROT|nr:NAD(P)-dependent oxidoreductase [Tistlia consotensis]SMF29775.1 glutamate synthase (NADPH) small subunit [Tistlia consotensis USBA 355]SNR90855.1 glutamate synthase (NADPH) small subunit [Tistlia consotensis]
MSDRDGVRPGRLESETLAANFADKHPPLDRQAALVESNRCYFCFDAPCVQACPTGIDIPGFIRKIQTGNLKGSAVDILSANIMGGMCARVCPVEELCEEACVRNYGEAKPVAIGALQRYATDHLFAEGVQPFSRAAASGRTVAVVGAGPAGLSCAHRLARLGHEVVVFEAKDKAGGLNEYGIAAYKATDGFAQQEVAFILSLGGIRIETGRALGRDVTLDGLRRDYDAVFLGVGLATTAGLGLEGEDLPGVEDAVAFIERLRQAGDRRDLPVGRRVVVVGGGNTAIDAAVQSRLLGAETVTLLYRRGPEQMSATRVEQDWARTHGVTIRHWAVPTRLVARDGRLAAVACEATRLDGAGQLAGTGERFELEADQLLKAIGQKLLADPLADGSAESAEIERGKLKVDAERATSLKGVWAGGDCIAGQDLTVSAVEDGKVAALAIDRYLRG